MNIRKLKVYLKKNFLYRNKANLLGHYVLRLKYLFNFKGVNHSMGMIYSLIVSFENPWLCRGFQRAYSEVSKKASLRDKL